MPRLCLLIPTIELRLGEAKVVAKKAAKIVPPGFAWTEFEDGISLLALLSDRQYQLEELTKVKGAKKSLHCDGIFDANRR